MWLCMNRIEFLNVRDFIVMKVDDDVKGIVVPPEKRGENAELLYAFNNQTNISTRSLSDEEDAAFLK